MNQNSFFKFIFTMRHCPEPTGEALSVIEKLKSPAEDPAAGPPENAPKKDSVPAQKVDLENIALEPFFEKDAIFQRDVVLRDHQRFQQIQRILQTGAICNVDDGLFFKKNAAGFLDFALRYLYPDQYDDEQASAATGQQAAEEQ